MFMISSTNMMDGAPDDIELRTKDTMHLSMQFATVHHVSCCQEVSADMIYR